MSIFSGRISTNPCRTYFNYSKMSDLTYMYNVNNSVEFALNNLIELKYVLQMYNVVTYSIQCFCKIQTRNLLQNSALREDKIYVTFQRLEGFMT